MIEARAARLTSATRRAGFWTVDAVKGGHVREHYQDIRRLMTEGSVDSSAATRLLDHATGTTPFYRPYAGRGLADFPIIEKATIRSDHERFRSEAFAGATLHRRSTSGSTGTPFSVVQDAGKRQRHIADTVYFNDAAGQRMGDRLVWLCAAELVGMSRWQQFSRNVIPIDHVGMDDADRASVLKVLRRKHGSGILSVSSTLAALARYATSVGQVPHELGVRVVISIGEKLQPAARDTIEAAFACPVVDRYANEENGVLACSTTGDDRLYLNRASYHFEFLKPEADEPQVSGRLARVVVTDLYNYAMPMIRYDTGDLAIVADEGDEHGPTALLSIEGRRADVIFDARGGQVSGTTVSAIMAESFPDLERYQLIQDGAVSYQLWVVPGDADYSESDLQAVLCEWLGADAKVAVEFVPSIPTGANGKHRPVIGRYRPESKSPGLMDPDSPALGGSADRSVSDDD